MLLIACAAHPSVKDEREYKDINPEFISYYQAFEKACGIKPNIAIQFKQLEENFSGACFIVNTTYRDEFNSINRTQVYIGISPHYWYNYSEKQRQWLIYHELGHCIFRLNHNEKINKNQPESIMYPYLGDFVNFLNVDAYLDKLCEEGKK
jgi:hypothetical protein